VGRKIASRAVVRGKQSVGLRRKRRKRFVADAETFPSYNMSRRPW
jgi:hypothetical protein